MLGVVGCCRVCCSVLRCVAAGCVAECCRVLQCVAMCCSALQCVWNRCLTPHFRRRVLQCGAVCVTVWCGVLQCVAVCCNELENVSDDFFSTQGVAVWCRVVWCVAVHRSVLQCVAVCCNELENVSDDSLSTQGVAVWCSVCCSASQCVPTSQKICLTIPFRRRTFAGGFPALMCGSNQVLYIVLGSGSCMVLQCAAVCCSVCSVW